MIARVFPRKTKATPTDPRAFFGLPQHPLPDIEEVRVSVTFIEDKRQGEELAEVWSKIAPTTIGGPAYDDPGGDFTPGLYLKPGYVITSRGCPRHCSNCFVPKREGGIRELPVTDGWNILDNNILATCDEHYEAVCRMLARQTERALFAGGLEARRLTDWHIERLVRLKPDRLYFAYDRPADLEPLISAGSRLGAAGFTRHHLYAYVLIGYEGDTTVDAEKRCRQAWDAGFVPFAMLYSDGTIAHEPRWGDLQRNYTRPAKTRRAMNPRPASLPMEVTP